MVLYPWHSKAYTAQQQQERIYSTSFWKRLVWNDNSWGDLRDSPYEWLYCVFIRIGKRLQSEVPIIILQSTLQHFHWPCVILASLSGHLTQATWPLANGNMKGEYEGCQTTLFIAETSTLLSGCCHSLPYPLPLSYCHCYIAMLCNMIELQGRVIGIAGQ